METVHEFAEAKKAAATKRRRARRHRAA